MKTATASYMLANNIPAIYIRLAEVNGELKVVADEIPINQVFNSGTKRPEELYFSFESVFEPYQQYSFDAIDGIDLVVKDTEGNFLSPPEVKLTVSNSPLCFWLMKSPPVSHSFETSS